MDNPIYVTQPYLPPLEELNEYLVKIWENKILTNNGAFHQEFEKRLSEFLGVKYLSLFTNGMLALVTSVQALKLSGEVITTPFSFVATSHSLLWNNVKPVFIDIDPIYFNMNPKQIEAAITPWTTAIMPVHVYGNPCNVVEIEAIANKHGLKVIYDSAHAFGVRINGKSITDFGDMSVLSFHATKVFNTFEGGAVICHNEETKLLLDELKNFGITGETTMKHPGINAKMNEFQAALGLLQLKYIKKVLAKRKILTEIYRDNLKDVEGLVFLQDIEGVEHNYAYFPICINSSSYGLTRDEVYEGLKRSNIFSRRYFYPLISQYPSYKELDSSIPGCMPIAEKTTKEILCLPIYPDLDPDKVYSICKIISDHNF